MKLPKKNKSLERAKRMSECFLYPPFQYKFPKNLITELTHNRSISVDKNLKPRLFTDYDQNKNQLSNEKKSQKSLFASKCKAFPMDINKCSAYGSNGTQSTKSNLKKNTQLKGFVTKNKNSQEKKIKNKIQQPLLKYMPNKHKATSDSPCLKDSEKINLKLKSPTKIKRRISQNVKQNINLKKIQNKIHRKMSVKKKKQDPELANIMAKNSTENKKKHGEDRLNQQFQDFGLTTEEKQIFGDRFPFGFEKIQLLGRGGFSIVWLGKHIKSGKQFAIKQIITKNSHQTHMKQVWFGTYFFALGAIPKQQFSHFEGINNLAKMYSYEINQKDTWIFYEKCGSSLGNALYDIKSQRLYGGQKIYKIHFKPLYSDMAKNPALLKNLTVELCKSLVLLNECQIVHSDLKTQNILIKYENEQFTEVKLIDYGSSFQFKDIHQFSMATPQYMPPQILNYILHENDGEYEQDLYEKVIYQYNNPWCIDMFSLGCVLLEIVVGIPLWMSLPLLVPNGTTQSYCLKEGLFAVKGRVFSEIIKKQRAVIERLDEVIENENHSKIVLCQKMKKVLRGMVEIDCNERISPYEVIKILTNQ